MYPLSPPLLSDSFFAPGTPQAPQGSAGGGGGGKYRFLPCPTLTGSWRGGVTGGVKSQSKPASTFLTFAPNSQGQPPHSPHLKPC